MYDKFLPRHQLIAEFLAKNAPKRFTVKEIAKQTSLSVYTVGNEMAQIMRLEPSIQRSLRAKVYKYWVGEADRKAVAKVYPPLTRDEFGAKLLYAVSRDNYVPSLVKLAWNLPETVLTVSEAVLSGESRKLGKVRQGLEQLGDSLDMSLTTIRRLLATDELWGDSVQEWMTEGLPEENLESLAEWTRQGLARLAKLRAQERDQQRQDD